MNSSLVIIVHTDKIESLIGQDRKNLYEFRIKDSVIFAKFFSIDERELLLCIDKTFQIFIFDLVKLKHDSSLHSPIVSLNLFENSNFFEESYLGNEFSNSLL